MLSMNIDSTKLVTTKVRKSGIALYLTTFAMVRQSQRKKPALPMPSTMIIMPRMNTMVDQLMPALPPALSTFAYQNDGVTNSARFKVSQIAEGLRMHIPRTTMSMSAPAASDTKCLSNFSEMITPNIITKIATEITCCSISFEFSHEKGACLVRTPSLLFLKIQLL